MFYQHFRTLNFICNIFGVAKPIITAEGKSIPPNFLIKIWCSIVIVFFITNYCLSKTITQIKLNHDLEMISDINDLVSNIIIILINIFNNSKVYVSINEMYNNIFNDFNFDLIILKSFALKIYFWFSIPTIMFIVLIILEIVSKRPPHDLLIRIPMFLSMMHLFMHLYVKLALTKVINSKLSKILSRNEKEEKGTKMQSNTNYILNPAIKFIKLNEHIHFDTKLLFKIYDNIGTSIHFLEQVHGLEILISIWLMFTNGVIGLTVIVSNKATINWLVIVKSTLPFFWTFIGCSISEQMLTEVDQTSTLIIKCLIDYRCVPSMKPALNTFKELVYNDRLQFTACNLFNLSYAMLLGTILNVITYSVILIQLFLNK